MNNNRYRRVCFTGHRPEKLTRPVADIQSDLEAEIRRAIADGITTFISGMARGVDLWAAQIVLDLRREGYPLKLICACPFPGFELGWKPFWQIQYQNILAQADWIEYLSPAYHPGCFQIRNRWMVRRAARVIAVYNGTPGGTRNTIAYAESRNVPVIQIPG